MRVMVLVTLIIGLLFLSLGSAMAEDVGMLTPALETEIISPGPGPPPSPAMVNDIYSSPDKSLPMPTGMTRTPTELSLNCGPPINSLLRTL